MCIECDGQYYIGKKSGNVVIFRELLPEAPNKLLQDFYDRHPR